ncbi:MAG: ABC transporter ATP-binding protein [Candidatus Wenzhouxiangella sp. M2_3B_020]
MNAPLLEVENLGVEFAVQGGTLRAVDDVSFRLERGRTLGLVGESGCGKSVTGLAIMGLLPEPAGRVASGAVRLDGNDLLVERESLLRKRRGAEMSMIFQDPGTALNPVYTVGRQITTVLRRHLALSRRQARRRAMEMLALVDIPLPERRLDAYPHELSGGMRQRVMIAMALASRPKLLVADEPTTALDVTTQAQVLEQIRKLQQEFGTAVLLITHDLGVIAENCDEALVMYCGRVVEQAATQDLFEQPRHRYTQGLIDAMPRLQGDPDERLPVIPGSVPDLARLPSGCRFRPRCAWADERCRTEQPLLQPLGQSRVACFHPAGRDGDRR